jgi:hypothetical protein
VGYYPREVKIANPTREKITFEVPQDANGEAFHVILTARDNGQPELFACRRAVIEVAASPTSDDGRDASEPIVQVGAGEHETPVTLHGPIRRGDDGALILGKGPQWGWVEVGEGAPLRALEGLRSLTILGWARASSLESGPGGNRIACNLQYDRDGFDLVHLGDGRMRLAVNQWPDHCKNDSEAGRLRAGEWVFFAVTYDATRRRNNVVFSFGDLGTPATPGRTNTYAAGPTGRGSGLLAVGNYNPPLQKHGLDRQFRGTLYGIRIFGSRAAGRGALSLNDIRRYQEDKPPAGR